MSARVLLAVRHAEPAIQGICYGRFDPLLQRTAHEAASRIVPCALGQLWNTVWSSPSPRCREPARLVASLLRVPLEVDARLVELDFGVWEGRTWSAIEREDAASLYRWMRSWVAEAPPGGESTLQLEGRIRSWWSTLPGGHHLLVAHAGVVRALRVIANGLDWPVAMSAAVHALTPEMFSLAVGRP